MSDDAHTAKRRQFERAYTAGMLLAVAALLLAANLFSTQLWTVKVALAVVLGAVAAYQAVQFRRHKGRPGGEVQ